MYKIYVELKPPCQSWCLKATKLTPSSGNLMCMRAELWRFLAALCPLRNSKILEFPNIIHTKYFSFYYDLFYPLPRKIFTVLNKALKILFLKKWIMSFSTFEKPTRICFFPPLSSWEKGLKLDLPTMASPTLTNFLWFSFRWKREKKFWRGEKERGSFRQKTYPFKYIWHVS